jgi:hypothetical protein
MAHTPFSVIPNATNKEAQSLVWTPVIKRGMMLDRNMYLHDTGASCYYYPTTTVLATPLTPPATGPCHHLVNANILPPHLPFMVSIRLIIAFITAAYSQSAREDCAYGMRLLSRGHGSSSGFLYGAWHAGVFCNGSFLYLFSSVLILLGSPDGTYFSQFGYSVALPFYH